MSVHARALEHTDSCLDKPISDESELTAGVRIRPGKRYGFFTDTTLCIGCKACEVACKEWNNLPADGLGLTRVTSDPGNEVTPTWGMIELPAGSATPAPLMQLPAGAGAIALTAIPASRRRDD